MLIAAYRVVCFTGVQTLIGPHPIIGNLRRNAKQAGSFPGLHFYVVEMMGFEPTTPTLRT